MFASSPIHDAALAIACRPGVSRYATFRALRALGFTRCDSFNAVCALAWAGVL